MISLKHVTKKYGNTSVLNSISYTFPQHGLVCLAGPSGGGKTTLLQLIAGFDSDYEGEIFVRGISLTGMTSEALCDYRRTCVGFIFQNYHLLSGYSVLENVLLASEVSGISPEESRNKAEALLEQLGMLEKKNQSCETLSGGQKQRVAIARALLSDPQIILADEPTGALDRETSMDIMKLLKEISKERLVVVVTHDEKLIPFADEVLKLKGQQLISDHAEEHSGYEGQELELKQEGSPKLFQRAAKNFQIHLKRYLIVAIALSVGLLAFLFSLSYRNVIQQSMEEFQQKNTAWANGYIKGNDDGTVLLMLQKDSRIEQIYYQYSLKQITLSLEGHTEHMEEKLPLPKATEVLSYGVMPRRGAGEIALSPSLAKKFAPELQNLLGKQIYLTVNGKEYPLTVSGIYNAGYDDFMVSSDIEQMFYDGIKDRENYSISYDVKQFEEITAVSKDLKRLGIDSQNAAKEVELLTETFHRVNRLFLIVSALILVIALFLCIVLLKKLQSSRSREVGLLSALGFQKNEIRTMLQGENLLLSCLAAGTGAILYAGLSMVCKIAEYPFTVGKIQMVICMAILFFCILAISGAASQKLLRTGAAQALRT